MKTWTETLTLAALAAVLTLAACADTPSVALDADMDEAAIAELDGSIVGTTHDPESLRRMDPDLDRERIRRLATGETQPRNRDRWDLSDAEAEILLDRMKTAKDAREEVAKR